MTINGLRNSIKQASFYIPFTLYFLLFTVAAVFCWNLLNGANYQPETSFADIFLLLLRIAGWFTVILICCALFSVVTSYAFYLYAKKKGIDFKFETDLKQSELHEKQTVHLKIRPILKPLFGFVKLRLQYDKVHYSNKFSLLENSGSSLFRNTIEGTYNWHLPQIKEYHVENAILYFEDFFQFFSIAVDLPASDSFFTQPTAKSLPETKVSPRKTEETTTRIEELRRVEGEYLNYKNFESNDDVRRIVWKIYAKNKELVVRIPETMDPYASHVYLYTSFFTSFPVEGNTVAGIPFLNYYKVFTWTVYQELVKKGHEVKYITDQDVSRKNLGDEQQGVKYMISTSSWHSNKDLRGYVNTKDASVIIISSFSDVKQVEELADRYGNDIRFLFVKLTDSLRKQNAFDWVQWVFVRNQDNDVESYKRMWSLSTLRAKVVENERRIEEVLSRSSVELVNS